MENNDVNKTKTILVTGAAGFIGFHLSKKLLEQGNKVIGFDNLNDYYDVSLKNKRLEILNRFNRFTFVKGDLAKENQVIRVFEDHKPEIVVNLAAQAGVRYSIENPKVYIESNINGFFNILEACRKFPVEQLIYASSSSVYGNQEKVPFSISDPVDNPISLYAATKKSNELMAYTYSQLYKIPTTGLRFFTVYGPYGRPDMAYFGFTEKILKGETIKVYNNGDMYRDFTYIDDIINAIEKIIFTASTNSTGTFYRLYNIGNNKPVNLLYFVETLGKAIGFEPKIDFHPLQPGDVYQTYADVSELMRDFGFKPKTSIEEGLEKFVEWYKFIKNQKKEEIKENEWIEWGKG